MSTTQVVTTVSVQASADLSAHQFKFGVINATGQVALVAGVGAKIDGVIANKPTAQGQATELQVDGIVKVIAASAITPGGEVAATAAGLAAAAATTNFVIGTYQGKAACTANDIIPVLVDKYYKP